MKTIVNLYEHDPKAEGQNYHFKKMQKCDGQLFSIIGELDTSYGEQSSVTLSIFDGTKYNVLENISYAKLCEFSECNWALHAPGYQERVAMIRDKCIAYLEGRIIHYV